jgi:hypothetical protein
VLQAVVLLLCIATVLAVPFIVSFETRLDKSLPLIHLTLSLIEAVFMLDIHMNFRTAFYSVVNGHFVVERREIACRYLWSGLLPDIIAALPLTICTKLWRIKSVLEQALRERTAHEHQRTSTLALLQCASVSNALAQRFPRAALSYYLPLSCISAVPANIQVHAIVASRRAGS